MRAKLEPLALVCKPDQISENPASLLRWEGREGIVRVSWLNSWLGLAELLEQLGVQLLRRFAAPL